MSEQRELMVRERDEPWLPAMTMAGAVERFNAVTRFTQQIMVAGRDYGVVPGSSKPTLLKPGAEKLTTYFGLSARPSLIEKAEDWTGAEHGGEPFFYYWFRYGLYRGDLLIAEADGSCNSWETKYRYRQGERKCPACGKATIIKGKAEYGGGWLCFAKRGGCGAKFKDADPAITQQEIGRVPNPNPADIANTVLKMAQKRALVAAVLLAANASEYFTQDIEDMETIEATVIDAPVMADTEHKAPAVERPKPSQLHVPDDEPEQPPLEEPHTQPIIDSPAKLLEATRDVTDGYYSSVQHLMNAITKASGRKGWPLKSDTAGWIECLTTAIRYANEQTAQAVQPEML